MRPKAIEWPATRSASAFHLMVLGASVALRLIRRAHAEPVFHTPTLRTINPGSDLGGCAGVVVAVHRLILLGRWAVVRDVTARV
jgi:hypothetical protein